MIDEREKLRDKINDQVEQAADCIVIARNYIPQKWIRNEDTVMGSLIRANERLLDIVQNLQTEIEALQFLIHGKTIVQEAIAEALERESKQ